MAYKILIRLRDAGNNIKVEYEARNLSNFSHSVTMPSTTFGLPESYLENAVVTKSDGNTGKTIFSWIVKDEATTPFNIMTSWKDLWTDTPTIDDTSEVTPHTNTATTTNYYSRKLKGLTTVNGVKVETSGTSNSDYPVYDLKTADGQVIALSELFEKKGLSSTENHQFVLQNYGASTPYNIYKQEGVITRMDFQKSGTDPVTWNVTVELQLGTVIDSSE